MLREACRQARAWRIRHAERGLPGQAPTVWVNLLARQFRQADLAEEVALALDDGLPPEGLGLEITENTLMEHGGSTVATLEKLKALGVKLAIDDFGTGYSTLSYLKRLPVDLLKIDRSSVAGLGKSPDDEVLVSAMINQALGLTVVAEGVETTEQLEHLTAWAATSPRATTSRSHSPPTRRNDSSVCSRSRFGFSLVESPLRSAPQRHGSSAKRLRRPTSRKPL